MVLGNDCNVGIVDGHLRPDVLRSLHQYIEMAPQSMFGKVRFSYISTEDEKLLSECNSIMLSHHDNSLSAMFRHDTRFVDVAHVAMRCAVKFELEYKVKFFHARASNTGYNMQSSQFIQKDRFPMCCRDTGIRKLFSKSNIVLTFVTRQ